jgi:pterin-4a-carbinolamine dehydratase
MEMFNNKVLKERIGPLKKTKNLDILEQVEGYVIRKSKENNLEHSYDVIAEEMPYFKTMGYTEYATNFYCQPLNSKFRTEAIIDAYNDECEIVDYASYLANNVKSKLSNKYTDRKQDFEKYEDKDYLVVLPGSNKLKQVACLNKLRKVKERHGDNIYFKPHPITTHAIIGEIKDFFGEDCILPRDIDMYYFLEKAKKVYTTHISESAVYSVALGKEIEPIDVWNQQHRGSFYAINHRLFDNQENGVDFINRVFSSSKSGFFNPNLEENWKHKVDQYFEYIISKRNKYRNWYIDDAPKKNKK